MILVLANPSSSGFTGAALRDVLARLPPDAEAHWPETADETAGMAASADDDDVVVAMGGDGMVHHVVRGLMHSGAALGIIPVGTTNVVARLLDVPSRPLAAADLVATRSRVEVPLAEATWSAPDGAGHARPVVFSLGLGWDAEVVASAEREPFRKATGGIRLYVREAVTQLRREVGRLPDLSVDAHGSAADGPAMAFQAQLREAYTFAGPRPIRLGPAPVNGLRVASWRRLRAKEVVPLALAATTAGGAAKRPDVDTADVGAVTVVADHAVRLQIDGEPLGQATEVSLAMVPGGLDVVPGDGWAPGPQ